MTPSAPGTSSNDRTAALEARAQVLLELGSDALVMIFSGPSTTPPGGEPVYVPRIPMAKAAIWRARYEAVRDAQADRPSETVEALLRALCAEAAQILEDPTATAETRAHLATRLRQVAGEARPPVGAPSRDGHAGHIPRGPR